MPPSSASPLPDLARLLEGRPAAWPLSDSQIGRDFSRFDSLALAPILDRRLIPVLPDAADVLSDRLAKALSLPAVTLFRSGTGALFQGLARIVRAGDIVLADLGNQGPVFEAVRTARARLCLSPPGSAEGIERRLTRLRGMSPRGDLWVVVPAISAHASVMSDLAELATLCQAHGARLIVDVSQDFGVVGQAGGGVQEVQGCMGRADVVVGDLTPTFVGKGSFVAVRDPDLARRIVAAGAPMTESVASRLVVALGLTEGLEGRSRRRALHGAVLRLRNQLLAEGVPVLGHPSPFVPVGLPPDLARQRAVLARKAGFDIPFLQAPLVAGRAPRWRIQLTAAHGLADIDDLAGLVIDLCRLPPGHRVADSVDALT